MSYITPRPISGAELEVLQTVLLRAVTPHTPQVTPDELKSLVVYSKCDCGCASVGFLPEGTKANENTKLIADGLGLSPDNKQVGIIVYGSPGQVVEVEFHWPYEGGAPLPRPETIVPWERGTEVTEVAK
ncbi:hypothetical protein [Ideonella sp. B508-1]|uniref:hypothetical protein n=1 Tax=Ideonella sp. B508-1 TaxID=137716 RepID=UPI0011D25466|nr:hypothetical protein [Ideonella sp. B508-1]